MAGTIGKAFRITKNDVKGYGYARASKKGKSLRANPGVTAIAAVNGRGSFGRRGPSARAAMNGLSAPARLAKARKLMSVADRKAFRERMRAAKKAKFSPRTGDNMRTNASRAQIAAARKNIRKAIAARRKGLRRNTGAATKSSSPVRRRRRPMAAASARGVARRSTAGMRANRRRSPAKRRVRRNGQTAAQRRASLKNLRKARSAAKRPRRMAANGRRRTAKRRVRRNASRRVTVRAKRRAPKRRALRANPRRGKRRALRRNRRRSTKRTMRRNRQTLAQRRASLKNLRKARAAAKRPRRMAANGRRRGKRRMRRNSWPGQRARHSTAAKKGWSKRRRPAKKKLRANKAARRRYLGSAKAFRKNQYMATMKAAFGAGLLMTAGFAGHKVVTRVLCKWVCDPIFGAPEAATPPATSGLEMLQPYKNNIAGAVAALAGIGLTNMLVKDVRTKMFITGGIATSFLHTVLVTVLSRVSQPMADALSGAEDATAARLSAMYGLGAGTSIQPRYAAINGLGEYFSEMNGLGQYTPNPDLMQAAAGYGTVESRNSNHIDPSSDLDRELSIAEAAAGVGQVMEAAAGYGAVQPFEASAGMGEYFAEGTNGLGEYFAEGTSGLGNIASLPSADTWIPGTTDPQLWAGTRAVRQPQSAHAMVSAGILQSGGNQGVFG